MPEAAQATYYEQVLVGVDTYEWLEKVFFYQLLDEPPDSPDRWGILRMDLSPKPAYETYQRYIAAHVATAALCQPPVDRGTQPS